MDVPKSVRHNAVVGFSNSAHSCGTPGENGGPDCRLGTRSRHGHNARGTSPYTVRRSSKTIVEQLALFARSLRGHSGSRSARRRLRGRRLPRADRARLARPRAVATSDRRRVSSSSTISYRFLQREGRLDARAYRGGPGRGAESGYGVAPQQVPDLIALRGDPDRQDPRRAGIGPKKAAEVLKQHGSTRAGARRRALPQIADDLLVTSAIATMDASAPLPPLAPDTAPNGHAPPSTERARPEQRLGDSLGRARVSRGPLIDVVKPRSIRRGCIDRVAPRVAAAE